MSKLTDEELKTLKELNGIINGTLNNMGVLEIQKQDQIKKYNEAFKRFKVLQDEMKIKYGNITVDIATGEITENKEDGEKEGS
tara:strand:- start:718 stop:966 length:249 start_codon:yes stop_codon:yes gene_type:complete